VWARTAEGKAIPLDPRPPIYEVVRGEARLTREKYPDAQFCVSHFATCPKASEFSGSKRRPAEEQPR
jgi:hypothetical protein